jgi:hypothetical protein
MSGGAAPPADARRQAVSQFFAARRAAAAGDKVAALKALEAVAAAHRGFYPGRQNPLRDLLADPAFARVGAALRESYQASANGKVAYRIDQPRMAPEGIAYDPRGKRLLLSDWVTGNIYAVRRGRPPAVLLKVASLNPNGLTVDTRRNVLWIVATDAFVGAAKPRSELIRIDLATGRRTVYGNAEGKGFNDVAVAPNGDVYVSDTAASRIFRLRHGAGALETVLTPDSGINSPNGLTVDDSGNYLFIAQGMTPFRLRLSNGEVDLLGLPSDLDMIGTDGFYFRRGALYAVQNLVTPGRILKLRLNETLDKVTAFEVLDSGHPAFNLPTTGALVGNRFLVIANSQLYRMANKSPPDLATIDPLLILEYPATD